MSARKPRDQFHMRCVAELIDWDDALDPIAAIDQDPRIADEGRNIAGDRNHDGSLACGKLKRLRLRALSRRIEHDYVELAQLLRHKGPAEQIARLGLDRFQSRRG